MTTYYIDPSYTTGGDGSLATPFDSWSDVTWTAGNSYLQKCGTTFTGGIDTGALGAASLGAETIIGSYGSGAKPIIDARGTTRGINIRGAASYVIVQDLEIIGGATGTATRGINSGFAGDGRTDYVTIRRCEIHGVVWDGSDANDCDGIWLTGDYNTVEDCVIYDVPDDGIWIDTSTGSIVRRNRIFNVGTSLRDRGDCIQISDSLTASANNMYIGYNDCQNTNHNFKHGIIYQNVASGYGGMIEYNTVRRNVLDTVGAICIYCSQPGATVRRNTTIGGKFGVAVLQNNSNVLGNTISQATQGIYHVSGTGVRISGNVIRDGGIGVISDVDGALVDHNTFVDLTNWAVYEVSGGSTTRVRNNNIVRCASGISGPSTVVASNNNLFSVSQATSGTISPTNGLTVDPALRADYMPMASAVRSAGTYLGGGDYYGKSFGNTPTIGAVQYQAVRSLTTQTLRTRSVASRSLARRRVITV